MICPYCAHQKTEVMHTEKGSKNERTRKCRKCGKSFMTIEAIKFDDYWKFYAKALQDSEKK